MEPSRRNLSAAVVVLLLVMVAEIAPVQAGDCLHLSGKFHGWCLNPDHCADVCRTEGKGYTGGRCHGWFARCYCTLPCAAAPAAAPASV